MYIVLYIFCDMVTSLCSNEPFFIWLIFYSFVLYDSDTIYNVYILCIWRLHGPIYQGRQPQYEYEGREILDMINAWLQQSKHWKIIFLYHIHIYSTSKNTIMSVICWKNVLFGSYFELFGIIRYYSVLFGIKCNRV